MSSESGRFGVRQECEVSMWLLTDGPVPFSDGVCAFLGNGLGLFLRCNALQFLTVQVIACILNVLALRTIVWKTRI